MSANRPFCCTQCPKVFTRNVSVYRPSLVCLGSNSLTQICVIKENLERHKRSSTNSGERISNRVLTWSSEHQQDSQRPYQCFRCEARFSRRDVCKRHAERCRSGQNDAEQYQSQDFNDSQCEHHFLDNPGSSSAATNSVSPEVVQEDSVRNPDTDRTNSLLLVGSVYNPTPLKGILLKPLLGILVSAMIYMLQHTSNTFTHPFHYSIDQQ